MTELGKRGARLMGALMQRDPELPDDSNPLREVALSACLTADRVERLERLAATVDPFITLSAASW